METKENMEQLWSDYVYEMENGVGFGKTSEWSNGPRSFAQFCASKRIESDTEKALAMLGINENLTQ